MAVFPNLCSSRGAGHTPRAAEIQVPREADSKGRQGCLLGKTGPVAPAPLSSGRQGGLSSIRSPSRAAGEENRECPLWSLKMTPKKLGIMLQGRKSSFLEKQKLRHSWVAVTLDARLASPTTLILITLTQCLQLPSAEPAVDTENPESSQNSKGGATGSHLQPLTSPHTFGKRKKEQSSA